MSQDLDVEVVGVDDHHLHAGFGLDLVAHAVGLRGDADAVFAVLLELMVVEPVETGYLLADHLVEHAPVPEQLAHARADRRPDHARRADIVDGELHLIGAVHADTGRRGRGEAGEEARKAPDRHVLFVHDALLAQGDDLLT